MIMKRFCLVSLLMLLAFNVRGQENEVEDFNNLIISGIKSYIEEDLNNMIISSIKSYIDDDYNTNYAGNMYKNKDSITYNICVDGLPRSFPYDSLKNVNYYTLLNPSSFTKSQRRKFKKGISIIEISIRASHDKIIIILFPGIVKLKRNRFYTGLSSIWFHYTYSYSQEQKKWILINKEEGGI